MTRCFEWLQHQNRILLLFLFLFSFFGLIGLSAGRLVVWLVGLFVRLIISFTYVIIVNLCEVRKAETRSHTNRFIEKSYHGNNNTILMFEVL